MKVRYLLCTLITLGVAAFAFEIPTTRAQTSSNPPLRSRSERNTAQRKVEVAYPDLTRALRVLSLPAQKMAEARAILERYEAETRAAREELRQLSDLQSRQDYGVGSTPSPRAQELGNSLAQSDENLRAELRTILTSNQKERFDRHLQKRDRHKAVGGNPRGHNSRAERDRP